MKIFDISCFYGHWTTYPVRGAIKDVASELSANGITTGFISPLAAAWCRNPQAYNRSLLSDTRPYGCLSPAPVLDPSLPTWREEADNLRADSRVKIFRVFLNYTRFNPGVRDTLDDFFAYFDESGFPLIIQCRMEDSRYNHHLAVVPDVNVESILRTALRFPEMKLVLAGASVGGMAELVLKHEGIYLDTSQMDGMSCARRAIDKGMLSRLVFGSHIPLFETYSAFARILHDVNDDEAAQIFSGNIEALLGLRKNPASA